VFLIAADGDVQLVALLQVRGRQRLSDGVEVSDARSGMPGGYNLTLVHCPSETTSTEPSDRGNAPRRVILRLPVLSWRR
jgi:hypothetical protein